ncbi:MAG: hypothetical protein KDA41_13730 [Planctomycetales bacterium]|nr:hypothetical protein [Planctomycetales bacterium]
MTRWNWLTKCALTWGVALGCCSLAYGQLDDYNPYAKTVEEPPVREDGSLH